MSQPYSEKGKKTCFYFRNKTHHGTQRLTLPPQIAQGSTPCLLWKRFYIFFLNWFKIICSRRDNDFLKEKMIAEASESYIKRPAFSPNASQVGLWFRDFSFK